MTIALIIVGSIMAYAFMAGLVGNGVFRAITRNHCKDWSKACDKHQELGVVAGVLWPLAAPFVAGAYISDRDGLANRKKLKHERRMKELEAERRLAEAKKWDAAEAMQYLIDNGIKADPKMFEKTPQN